MPGPFVPTDFEHAFQLESVFNTAPGAPVGGDFVRFRTRFPFKRVKARRDRDGDSDNSASVITTQGGRESCTWEAEGDVTPSGNAATPTMCDADPLYEAHHGQKTTCTAHTTTAAGSSGTTLNLTPGGGAASGIPTTGGVHIMVDVDATNGYEVRRVISRSTDVVTIDRAFTVDPASGRTVKVCSGSYKFAKAQLKTLHGYVWLSGDNFREKAGGLIAQILELAYDGGADVPMLTNKFSGPGAQIATFATTKPTPVVGGVPLAAGEAKVWFGTTKHCLTSMQYQSDNAIELRQSEFCNLFPTGVKRTKNNGRYNVTLNVGMLLTTGTIEGYFDNADLLTAYDVLIQVGVTPGQVLAISIPRFIPDVEVGDVAGEVALTLSGRALGTVGDDEVLVSFL